MDASPVLPPAAAACGISFDGRAYHYRDYSYDRIEDALAYARQDRARPGYSADATPRRWRQWVGPDPEQRVLMAAHGIVYERGYYHYGPYRYDQLSAALAYARQAPARPDSRQPE